VALHSAKLRWTEILHDASQIGVRAGFQGTYADVAIHAGLICLYGPEAMDLDLQLEPAELMLDDLVRGDQSRAHNHAHHNHAHFPDRILSPDAFVSRLFPTKSN